MEEGIFIDSVLLHLIYERPNLYQILARIALKYSQSIHIIYPPFSQIVRATKPFGEIIFYRVEWERPHQTETGGANISILWFMFDNKTSLWQNCSVGNPILETYFLRLFFARYFFDPLTQTKFQKKIPLWNRIKEYIWIACDITLCFFPLVSITSERLGDTEARRPFNKSRIFILIFIWKVTFPQAV